MNLIVKCYQHYHYQAFDNSYSPYLKKILCM